MGRRRLCARHELQQQPQRGEVRRWDQQRRRRRPTELARHAAGRPYHRLVTRTEPIRLTRFSHGAGCACKLSPADLRTVLGPRARPRRTAGPTRSDLLVGLDTADDAAVYRLRDDLAVVVTTDFFTPIVDDPYDWGRIAATNALSDVYAMGGAPLLALNLVAWPREGLPFELLARVLDGGGRRRARRRCARRRRSLDRRPRAEVRARGRRHRPSRPRASRNAGARPGDAARAHEADRARRDLDRGEA